MDYAKALEVAIDAAKGAGALLLEEFYRDGGARGADGHCPSDTAAERLIGERLREAFATYGIRGEELGYTPGTDAGGHVWVVDPNDGTSAFQRGHRGSAVSIALLAKAEPVLGVVFAYGVGTGDLIGWAKGCGAVRRNGKTVAERLPKALKTQTILVSQDSDNRSAANAAVAAPGRFRAVASIAYRLALVAVGEGDMGMSIGTTGPQGWDYAAGDALLRGVGGALLNADGEVMRYSADGDSNGGGACYGVMPWTRELALARDWQGVLRTLRAKDVPYPLVKPATGMHLMDAGVLARAQGCLIGQVAGDSLGGLVEFQSAARIRAAYPNGLRELVDGGHWDALAGQPTDDSEMAIMLARAIVGAGGFDEQAAARAYLHWYASRPFDMGNTVAQALRAAGRDPADPAGAARRGANVSSQANGALMRVSPLGIFGHAMEAEQVAAVARADAMLTHPNPVCLDANAVFVVTIARAIRLGEGPAELYAFACDWAKQQELHADVRETLTLAATKKPTDYSHQMGWVRIALQNAFYQLLHAKDSEAGVVASVMEGGDTDTNAAIAGALLGAVYGVEGLPARWVDRVVTCRPIDGLAGVKRPRPKSFWPVDAMVLAERLAVLGMQDAKRKEQMS